MNERRKKLLAFCALWIAAAVLISTGSAFAAPASQGSVTMTVSAGFDSYCQDGAWLPVRVVVENNGPDIDGFINIETPDNYGGSHTYSYHIALGTVSRKEVTIYITPVGYVRNLDVTLIAGNKELAAGTTAVDCLANTDMLYGILAGNPSAFNIFNNLDPTNGRGVVAQLETGEIPENSRGLEALDVLLISDIDTGVLTEGQRGAIRDWTAGGGYLIVTGGLGWQKTSAGLGDLLPFQPDGTGPEVSLDVFGQYAGLNQPLEGTAVSASGTPTSDATTLKDSSGNIVSAWHPYGAGIVHYLTVDPSLDPLNGWDGIVDVYRVMLASRVEQAGWSGGFTDWYSASQAASILPGLSLPSIFLICGFLAAYVLAIGPLNFFILMKLKKRELAWVSIPLTVLFFSGFAIFIGLLNRGGQTVLNQVAVVRAYPDMQLAQVDGVVGVYSPSRSTYNLTLQEGFLAHPVPQSFTMTNEEWGILEDNGVIHLPNLKVDVGAVKSFVIEGTVPAPKFSHTLTLTQNGNVMTLSGTVTNESGATLTDSILLAPGQVFKLGIFKAGETKQISVVLDKSERAPGQLHTFYVTSGSSASPTGYSYYYGSDTTINEIIGSYSYYDDPVMYRRYSLVAGLLNNQNSGMSGRGGGIYVTGWVDKSPVSIQSSKKGQVFDVVNTTLYLINLKPGIPASNQESVLPPPMFVWKVLESTAYTEITPYNTFVSSSRYSIQFSLAQTVPYSRVKDLTFHYYSSTIKRATDLRVYLWDYTTQSYVQLDISNFGDIQIASPEKYVGPGGEILLQVDSFQLPADGQLDRTDFTLTVEP